MQVGVVITTNPIHQLSTDDGILLTQELVSDGDLFPESGHTVASYKLRLVCFFHHAPKRAYIQTLV